MKIIFYLSKHQQAKVRRLLNWYLFLRLLHLSLKFDLLKCLETRHHLGSGCKTVKLSK